MTWKELYNRTKKYMNEQDYSPFIHGGQVATGIETASGKVYFGVNIDTSCDIGTCAERSAILNMITHGETEIKKVVTIGRGEIRMPCGVCREAMMQLHKDSGDIELLVDPVTEETIKLKELMPNWWGTDRFD